MAVHKGLNEKKLHGVMKRFLALKDADPQELKYFKVDGGIHYLATNKATAVSIFFENKYDKASDGVEFWSPTGKDEHEKIKDNPEFPDVRGLFEPTCLEGHIEISIDPGDVDKFIKVHEAMNKAAKLGGMYVSGRLELGDFGEDLILFRLYDSEVNMQWIYDTEVNYDGYMDFYYNFDLMTDIFKSLKDLKPDSIKLLVKDSQSPVYFTGTNRDYNFHFAIQRKLVR